MQTVELFSGKESFSKRASMLGLDTFTVDFNSRFNPDLCIDIINLKVDQLPRSVDILFASPDCGTFSIASGGKHFKTEEYKYRKYKLFPITERAKFNFLLIDSLVSLIFELNPKFYFIENPRGLLNHHPGMLKIPIKRSIYYADYGTNYMKPTDIWTNCINWIPKVPKHKYSYRLPTKNLNNKSRANRSVIPAQLCDEIIKSVIN